MSHSQPTRPLLDHFSALEDPRQSWRVVYPLPEILLLVLCATLSGMDDFVETKLWGEQRLDFLRRFLAYDRGIPSHDTLNDVMNALDPALFKACFTAWVAGLRESEPDTIAIDGKTSRRSHARAKGREPLHLVSAWACRQRLVLGQEAVRNRIRELFDRERNASFLYPGGLVAVHAVAECPDGIDRNVLSCVTSYAASSGRSDSGR